MSIQLSSRVYCVLRGRIKQEDPLMDYNEFDTLISEVSNTLRDRDSYRQIELHTNYFSDSYGEILLVFRVSYLERNSEIEAVIIETEEELESHADFATEEREIEQIV